LDAVDLDPHLEPRAAQFRVELRLIAETMQMWTRIPLRGALFILSASLRVMFFALSSILVSSAIQIGLALPMAQYFHRVSFTGLSANLLVVPLLEFALPAGFVAVATGWHWPALFTGGLLRWAGAVASWHARFEPSWRIADPPVWLTIAFTVAIILFATVLSNRRWRWPAAAAVIMCLALLLIQPWSVVAAPRQLELTAIDVGQGESLLLMLPEGQRMVIDGGGLLQFGPNRTLPGIDTGEDVISPYL
jgi:competence protein ComEC